MVKKLVKTLALVAVGGTIYYWIEIFYRGRSHPSMFFVGGLCFWLVGLVNQGELSRCPIWAQGLMGAAVVTGVEFLSGCILNLWLGWGVWDYSGRWGNLLGQVCPAFTLMWVPLTMAAVVLDDWLRFFMWQERRPSYRWRWGRMERAAGDQGKGGPDDHI